MIFNILFFLEFIADDKINILYHDNVCTSYLLFCRLEGLIKQSQKP